MGKVINFESARLRRGLPLSNRPQDLEARIFRLLPRLDNPAVVAEIIKLRNEVWLLETSDGEHEHCPTV